eukprot:CCRYP_004125-RA/>CCRYP_004125-RA protein AED:0.08 eAED:0.08 QI:185/1/1/1/0.8/0.66/6/581/324
MSSEYDMSDAAAEAHVSVADAPEPYAHADPVNGHVEYAAAAPGDHGVSVDVDTGLVAPDLPPIELGDAAAAVAAAAAAEGGMVPGLPPLIHNAGPGFNLPELIIPAKWLARYEELKRFHATYGHCNVPQKYEENKQLGAWVRTQKQQYKLLAEGKPSHMSEARINLLNELGFEWSGEKRDKFWSERYGELVEFQQKHNSTRVPDKYPEAPQLHSWVSLQRRQLKLYKEGKKNKLTDERARMLEAIGLEWHIRNSCSWMERFLELKDYKEQHGNCNVPQKYKANPSLGRWVDNQKTQHKKLYDGKPTHLTIERIQLLVSLGFQFR